VQTADEAVAESIKSGSRVYVHTGAASPQHLLRSMAKLKGKVRRRSKIVFQTSHVFAQVKDVEVCNMTILGTAYGIGRRAQTTTAIGDVPHLEPDCQGSFRANSFFLGETFSWLSASVVPSLTARMWTAGGNHRQAIKENRGDFVPVFFR
jgi:hypothetical protein